MKIKDVLNKCSQTLDKVKDSLEKDLTGFGAAIGGGTKEKPTIKPTTETSSDVRGGGWFGQSENAKEDKEKEEVGFAKNGQWSISEVKDNGKK